MKNIKVLVVKKGPGEVGYYISKHKLRMNKIIRIFNISKP